LFVDSDTVLPGNEPKQENEMKKRTKIRYGGVVVSALSLLLLDESIFLFIGFFYFLA
jgi:hypothetical protein